MKKISLRKILEGLKEKDNFVFLETQRFTHDDYKSYLFTEPKEIICCKEPERLKASLESIETLSKKGYLPAGFISYEAGFAFEEALGPKPQAGFPLFWFGIYEDFLVFDHKKVIFNDDMPEGAYYLEGLALNTSEEEYAEAINKIKSYIEQGQTYQVNYTIKLDFSFSGSALDLYLALRKKQSVSYSALMKFDGKYIISFSPELFFRKDGPALQVKPMKGTADRGRYLQEDAENRKGLNLCPKNRSENIMIVDLLRNDLGRISEVDTVKTKRLFEVESYESLLQMTSTVESRMREGVTLYDMLKAVFPSGSVTGAPKIRTMQLIDELEKGPRNIYTGSIGFINKDKAVFNVAIRTILIDEQSQKGEMGIGSGVVYDSDADKEYRECGLKAKFLTDKTPDFQLIETMLWKAGGGYPFLRFHLERLSESAGYLNFYYDEDEIIRTLNDISLKFIDKGDCRVRLLLNKNGEADISYSGIELFTKEALITFSDKVVLSTDKFLFHKTTNRNLYNEEHKIYKEKGFYDIIFQNEKGEIAEGAISNIFIRKGDKFYTPSLQSGLLNGVYRRYLLCDETFPVVETVLYKEDIEKADEVILTNAVRGMIKAKVIKEESLVYA